MAIKRFGAQRFSALDAEVGSLPTDADLIGATCVTTDTLRSLIFTGTTWDDAAGGGGGITGLNPNSTILDYSTDITEYTTPVSATATSSNPNATFSDDFVYNDQAAADASWVRSDTVNNTFRVNQPNQDLDFDSLQDSSSDVIVHDLGLISDSAWTLRMKVNFSSISATAGNNFLFIGISSTDESVGSSGAQNFIGQAYFNSTGTKRLESHDAEGTGYDGVSDAQTNITLVVSTDYYFEVKRLTTTTYEATIYSDAEFTNVLATVAGTMLASLTGLRYIKYSNFQGETSTGSQVGTIDNVQFFDGTTSPIPNFPSDAIDGNTTTFWESNAGVNESITLNMGGIVNAYALAYYISTAELATMTETQFQIKTPLGTVDATGGDDISQDGNFTIHTFTTNGTFEIVANPDNIQFDVLVVAGGGGGSGTGGASNSHGGGGGGAGGFREEVSQAGLVQTYAVTIGLGGAAGSATLGTDGGDSIFDTITSDGGGAGNSGVSGAGNAGGSGGGGSRGGAGGAGVGGQGFAGGSGIEAAGFGGGGGGGANEVGTNATNPSAGSGGDGLQSSINGVTTFYSGGGGGGGSDPNAAGLGGSGGGGAGANSGTAGFGTDGLGGGGGGASQTAGDGGDGIVIVRYFNPQNSQLLRTVEKTQLTPDVYNFIRFNGINTKTLEIVGSSNSSLVMVANELAVQVEADPPLTTKHGQFTIPTITDTPLNGGDPTSSVIDDPQINTFTFNNVSEPADPPLDQSKTWHETLDANNDVTHTKMKIDGAIKNVRWF